MARLLLLAALLCGLAAGSLAQQYSGCGRAPADYVFAYNGNLFADENPIPVRFTVSNRLRNSGVPLTQDGLISALHNKSAQVRYLAAWQLADDDAKGAIPDIIETLSAEREPRARAYTACALAELGDASGIPELRRDCEDKSFPPDVRLHIVDFLIELHEQPCLSAVVDGVKAVGVDGGSWGPLFTIGNLRDAHPDMYVDLRRSLLSDHDRIITAFNMISTFNDVSAIPDIEAELAKVKASDWMVRGNLESLIETLQKSAATETNAPPARQ